ncbi:YhjD/YihY/BrkB family envelope integrity protein [Actinophytocola xanthii]|nr:YhjD/YihY/BrkB family envelope integrity protein [Actinophytocola xanthii]
MTSAWARARSVLAEVLADVRRALRGRDLVLWAAGLTFFGVLAVVPMCLLALRGAGLLFGADLVVDGARRVGESLPAAHDTTPALTGLARAAVEASWLVLVTAVLPASLYGEGLRRGLKAVLGSPVTGLTGWVGRLGFLPVLVAAPLLMALPLAFAPVVGPLYRDGGWSTVLGVVLSFHVDLVPVCVAVWLVLAVTGPSVLPPRAAALAAFVLGAVLTGFLHGFVLFLAIPIDWSVPFGGLPTVGAVVALALWLFGLHLVLLLGYRVALSAHTVHERGTSDVAVRPDPGALAGGRAGAPDGPAGVDRPGADVRRGEAGGDRGSGEAGGGPPLGELVRPGREPGDPV